MWKVILLEWQKARLMNKIARQAKWITHLEASRAELKKENSKLRERDKK